MNSRPGTPEEPTGSRSPLAKFSEDLHNLRMAKGLSYRELAKRTHYGRSSLAEAARGGRLPTLELTLAFVEACEGQPEEWRLRWTELRNQTARADDSGSFSAEIAVHLRPEHVSTRAEFLAALRALQQSSGLSYGGLERASDGQLSRSTLSDMLTGRTMPTWATTRSFLVACRPALDRLRQTTPRDLDAWHYAWERVREAEAEQPAQTLRRTPVQQCDPYQLGVHQAHLPGGASELPAYVHRGAAEEELRLALEDARNHNGFILLIGQSGAGKTRLAYEMMQRTLPDFGLLHPASTEELGAVPPPRTVIWLDDIDQYLRSGLTRAMLQALLRGPRSVIVLGTIWPSQYHAYMTLPQPGGQDIRQREREALTLATVIDVAVGLSPSELDSALDAARHDPRIAAAINSPDHGIFQTLAAEPHLMRRWNNAGDAYAEALITAAINTRRAGVQDPLDIDQLRELAWAQLSAAQKAQAPHDWLEKALAYATAPVPGGIAALTPMSGTPETDQANGYHVADLLVHRQNLPAAMQSDPVGGNDPQAPTWQSSKHRPAQHRQLAIVVVALPTGLDPIRPLHSYLDETDSSELPAALAIRAAGTDNWRAARIRAELLARLDYLGWLYVRTDNWHVAQILTKRDDLQIIWYTISIQEPGT